MPPPTIDLWENVPGVLSSRDNAFGCFLGALSGADCELQPPGKRWPNSGCVYGPKRAIAWRVLDAQYFGVAQRRRRVFVVASARKGFHPAQVLFEREGVHRDSPPRRGEGQDLAGTIAGGARKRGGYSTDDVPLAAFGGNNQAGPIDVATARNACNSASGRLDFESETLVVERSASVRRLTPRECERLQGFPDDYTLIPWRGKPAEACPDGPRYKAIGNSKAVPVVRWIAKRIEWALQHPWENDL
ncbi:DNA cytosine methyltransferase [Pseudomonas citronellolis]|uniref:DNA cytosine methyltransferase n=1 Tax=Pseudomonas citronellolis TaxID=53408 RepID=UPI003CD0C658